MARRKTRTRTDHSAVVAAIGRSFREACDHPTFAAWHKDQSLSPGDLIAINNSFVFRGSVETHKNQKFLAVVVQKGGVFASQPLVAQGMRFNSDLKLIPARSKKRPICESLEDAIRVEFKHLGKLVFLLIGSVEDAVLLEEPLEHGVFNAVVLDPRMKSEVEIKDGKILVKEVGTEDRVWEAVKTELAAKKLPEATEELRQKVGGAVEESLGDRAYAILRLPTSGHISENSVLGSIGGVLAEQREEYAESIEKCKGEYSRDPEAYNSILRIAYNFASDATGFLRLLVSVSDMKPIILCCTIGKHYKLSEAFRGLPWTRSRYKPSLASYERIIGDARNRAFHKLFPFRKPIDVILPGSSLTDLRLRIFSEHSRKKENDLTYQDKEMVDLLKEFTITREHAVPSGFWPRNLEVMDATIE